MKSPVFFVLTLTCTTLAAAADRETDPEMLYQQAWYLEEGLRDLRAAAMVYTSIASDFAEHKPVAAKALARAAGCYHKLGEEDLERQIWVDAWKNYKEEIEKSPEYKHDSIRIISMIENLAGNTGSEMLEGFSDILNEMPAKYLIPVRDRLLERSQQQRKDDHRAALRSLRFAILLSIQLKEEATAAMAQSRIGQIYFEQKNFVQAYMTYDETGRDYPLQRSVLAWNEMKMAEALRMMDRTLEAADRYSDMLMNYPEQTEQLLWGRLWMGDCLRELGNLEAAKRIWREVVENEKAKEHPRQLKLARMLTGLEKPPATVPNKDEFSNDEAYFVAVRHEIDGNRDATRAMLKLAKDMSDGMDWPSMLASQHLVSAGQHSKGQ